MFLPPPFPSLEELIAGSSLVVIAAVEAKSSNWRLPRGRFAKPRQRQSVADVYNLMGKSIFQRAFRMT